MNINEFFIKFIFNENKIFTLLVLPIEFLNIMLVLFLSSTLLEIKRSKRQINRCLLIMEIMYSINRITFNQIISTILFIVESVIILNHSYKCKTLKLISYFSILNIFIITFQLIISKILYSSNKNLNIIYEIATRFIPTIIFANLYAIIKNFNITMTKIKNVNKKEMLYVIIIACTSISIMYIESLKLRNFDPNRALYIKISSFAVATIFIYFAISNLSKTRKIVKANVYIDNLEGYNKTLTEMNDSIRSFKHDFNNIVQTINGYIMLDDIISLKKYFSGLLVECNQLKTIENLSPNIIKNPAIYSLLLSKYNLAKEEKIKIDLEVMFDLSDIVDETYDISRILGILLDNAIEACRECQEKNINIQFLEKNNIKYINIENSYNADENIDTCKIFEKNFTTKKEHGNTGIGLWEVKRILNKNKKIELYTTKNKELFKQSLEIYKNPIG